MLVRGGGFPSNRTFTLGSIYTLRLSATGGFDGKCWCAARAEQQGLSPKPPAIADTWAAYLASRTVCMNAWEDSRGVPDQHGRRLDLGVLRHPLDGADPVQMCLERLNVADAPRA
jgi:hypothetical protein